jgi:hypothetical protein
VTVLAENFRRGWPLVERPRLLVPRGGVVPVRRVVLGAGAQAGGL